jgi:amino acid permease
VVTTSFAIAIALFASMGALGFLTFGSSSAGLILNNYSNKDGLMSISRLAVALSIVFSYPLAFTGAREGVLDLFNIKNSSTGFQNTLTAGMLSCITVAALLIPDVSFVLAFAGATLGNALIYIYPALMFRGAVKKQKNPTKLQKFEVKVALTSAVLGLGMGTMGAIKAVQSIL